MRCFVSLEGIAEASAAVAARLTFEPRPLPVGDAMVGPPLLLPLGADVAAEAAVDEARSDRMCGKKSTSG